MASSRSGDVATVATGSVRVRPSGSSSMLATRAVSSVSVAPAEASASRGDFEPSVWI